MSFDRALAPRNAKQARVLQARELGFSDALASKAQWGGYFVEPDDPEERREYLAAYRRGEARRAELRR